VFIPKGIWKTYFKFEKDTIAEGLIRKDMNNQISAEINNHFNSIGIDDKGDNYEFIQTKVYKAIDYSISRHDWYENQRNRIFNIVIWLSGFILTFIGLMMKNSDVKIIETPPLLAILITVAISLITGLYLYNKELDSDRPYRLVSDVKFWFFRYNLPAHSEKTKDYLHGIATEVLKERTKFFDRISENFTIANSMREDFEQLFILQVLQRYKSESLTKLRWLMSYTIVTLIIEVIIYLIIWQS